MQKSPLVATAETSLVTRSSWRSECLTARLRRRAARLATGAVLLIALTLLSCLFTSALYDHPSRHMSSVIAASVAPNGDVHLITEYSSGEHVHLVVPVSAESTPGAVTYSPPYTLPWDDRPLPPTERDVILVPYWPPQDGSLVARNSGHLVVDWGVRAMTLYDPQNAVFEQTILAPLLPPLPETLGHKLYVAVATPFAIALDIVTAPIFGVFFMIYGID